MCCEPLTARGMVVSQPPTLPSVTYIHLMNPNCLGTHHFPPLGSSARAFRYVYDHCTIENSSIYDLETPEGPVAPQPHPVGNTAFSKCLLAGALTDTLVLDPLTQLLVEALALIANLTITIAKA